MRGIAVSVIILGSLWAGSASADTCSGRASLCQAACTPALVASGEQHGGTVSGCRSSCASRLRSCMRTGIWVHMGSRTRGQQQQVERK